jgi:hypothetical protein
MLDGWQRRAEAAQRAPGGGPQPRRQTVRPRAMLNRFDREMMTVLVAWAPYGGPPTEDVWFRFGMGLERLRERVREVVLDSANTQMHAEDYELTVRSARVLGLILTRREKPRRPRP